MEQKKVRQVFTREQKFEILSRLSIFGTLLDKGEFLTNNGAASSCPEGEHGKPSRGSAEKRYEIVKETLRQKERLGRLPDSMKFPEAFWRTSLTEGSTGIG